MNVALKELFTSPVTLVLLAYGALVIALAYALQPMRLRMVALGEDLLAQPRWNRSQREEINNLLDTMDSLAYSLVLPLAVLVGTVMVVFRGDIPRNKDLEELSKDDTFDRLTTYYFASLVGSNPLAGILTIALLIVCAPIMLIAVRGSFMEAVEKPVLQASTAVMSAYQGRRLAA